VLDLIYGEEFLAALKATAIGERVVTIGVQNSMTANLNIADLFNRWHTCQGTGQNPPETRRAAWLELLDLARTKMLDVLDYVEFGFDQVVQAWETTRQGAHGKVVATVGS
jgi:NADPH:quinone reductase-like Zn-dependent oxidoreductase